MSRFSESEVENAALAWLESIGWQVAHGPDIAPDMLAAERADYGEVVLSRRLRQALTRLNPTLPAEALDDAFRQLVRGEGAELLQRNRAQHRLLVDGVTVEYRDSDGAIRGAQARVIDFDDPANNDWLAVNQFSVVENKHSRRPDVVLFVNGLPLAVLELKNAASSEFEEATEGEEVARKEKLKTKWAQLEAVVGSDKRLSIVARDIVDHFEQRLEALDGKAMVVCMSRRICVELHRAIVKLRPDWQSADDDGGAIKVVMTGSASDLPDWQPHIRNKPRREALANRFRDAADPLRIVLVRDMWLTGFDAPSLHTMYLDKPMRGHGLMQAIARVNRVFKDKPGGLVVDYLGLAHELKRALATYTESGGTGRTALDQDEAVAVMLEKYEVCCGLFHGFERATWTTGRSQERLGLLPPAQEHILAQENGKERCVRAVRELSQSFALAVPHEEALRIRDDLAFFQAVQAVLAKRAPGEARPEEELDHAVRQIISRAVTPEGVVDIFAAAGLEKPDISILSDEFLAEVRGMPQRNLAVELLQKQGGAGNPAAQERRAGALLCRDARANHPAVPESGPRGGAGDPDKQEKATQTVLEQAALLSAEWAAV